MAAKIRQAAHTDREKIFTCIQQVGLLGGWNMEQWKKHWHRMWVENPALKNQHASYAIGWVIEENNSIVGYFGNVVMPYYLKSQKMIAACASIWAVEPKYRQFSMGLAKQFFDQSDIDLFINTTANLSAGKAFALLKAKQAPAYCFDKIHFWITNPEPIVQYVLKKYLAILPTKLLSKIISLPIKCLLYFKRPRPVNALKRYTTQSHDIDNLDDKINELWGRLLSEKNIGLLACRNKEMIQWHYADPADTRRPIFIGCYNERKALIGYAILRRDNIHRIGLPRMRLVDIAVIPKDNEAIDTLLLSVYDAAKKSKTSILELNLLPEPILNRINKLKTFSRLQHTGSVFLKAKHSDLLTEVMAPFNWWLTRYDGDASL